MLPVRSMFAPVPLPDDRWLATATAGQGDGRSWALGGVDVLSGEGGWKRGISTIHTSKRMRTPPPYIEKDLWQSWPTPVEDTRLAGRPRGPVIGWRQRRETWVAQTSHCKDKSIHISMIFVKKRYSKITPFLPRSDDAMLQYYAQDDNVKER